MFVFVQVLNITIVFFLRPTTEPFHPPSPEQPDRGKTNIFTFPSIDEEGNLSPCKLPEGNEQKLYEYLESIGPVVFFFCVALCRFSCGTFLGAKFVGANK